MTNISDIPRNLDAIKALPSMVRYRVALTTQIMPNDGDAIAGFSARTIDEQCQMILNRLVEIDAQNPAPMGVPAGVPRQPDTGQPGQAPAQAGPPPGQYSGHPPMGNGALAPGQMGAPGQYGGAPQAPMHGAPMGAPQGAYQAPGQMAAPGQMQAPPGFAAPNQPQGQLPPRTPSTSSDPGPQMGAPNSAMQGSANDLTQRALAMVLGKLAVVQKTIDDEVPGVGDLEEIREICLGIAATQQVLSIMVLLLLDGSGMPRQTIYQMVREEVAKDPTSPLLAGLKKDAEAAAGK